eukprot:5181788-Prymnesium_polylepis.1
MSVVEWGALVRDVQLGTTVYPTKAAIGMFNTLFEQPDFEMYLHDFLPLLLRTAFARANPEYVDARSRAPQFGLPDAFERLLQEAVLPLAHRDDTTLLRLQIVSDAS